MPMNEKEVKSIGNTNRPSWDQYFLELAGNVANRSTCLRRHVGALLVVNRRILTTGYNGVPSGLSHCGENGKQCLRQDMNVPSGTRQELCRGLHAEQNAIIQAALHGVSTKGATLYCTHQPCITCAKMLINAGVERIVYKGEYPDELSMEMIGESGILIERIQTN